MKRIFKYLCLSLAVITLQGACAKKSTPVAPEKKKEIKIEKDLADDKSKAAAKAQEPSQKATDSDRIAPGDLTPPPSDTTKSDPTPAANAGDSAIPVPGAPSKLVSGPADTTRADAATAKPPLRTTSKIEDTLAIEKCFRDQTTNALTGAKAKNQKISNALDVQGLKLKIKDLCKKDLEIPSDLNSSLVKILIEQIATSFPGSEATLALFSVVENKKLKDDERTKIYALSRFSFSVESKSISFSGVSEVPPDKDNIISYAITEASGALVVSAQPPDKEMISRQVPLENISKMGIKYSFNFTMKPNKTGQLMISEKEATSTYDFVIQKGTFSAMKAKNEITISLTPAAWDSLLETQQKNFMTQDAAELLSLGKPKSTKEPNNPKLSRVCVLNLNSINCQDPDYVTRTVLDPTALAAGQ